MRLLILSFRSFMPAGGLLLCRTPRASQSVTRAARSPCHLFFPKRLRRLWPRGCASRAVSNSSRFRRPSCASTLATLANTWSRGAHTSLVPSRAQPSRSISPEAADHLQRFYLELRQTHRSADSAPITTRQLESLMRLAEARARLELRENVTEKDAQDAIELMCA